MADVSDEETATTNRYKVYTKTGDKGTSSLYTGERRQKDDVVFQALGDVDELNSAVGIAREHCRELDSQLTTQLEEVQSRLLDVGSAVATPAESSSKYKKERVRFDDAAITNLECWIDAMDEELPQLTNFILPSGGHASAALHMARSICRRAERAVVPLGQAKSVEDSVTIYLNRLSDYLFTAARLAALRDGKPEVVYKKA